jgi:alginate O-acetyltransferase complex protein AlgI
MLFNTFEFAVFFPTVVLLYYALPRSARPSLLLIASCAFYMAFIPAYILVLAFIILVDYAAGRLIEASTGFVRRGFLLMSIAANVGTLAVFKYYGFLEANLQAVGAAFGQTIMLPTLMIVLPIGLSFHTFQAMSYTVEVYRGTCRAEQNFVIYALYVMFFPQLVAGPIERPQHLIPQLRAMPYPDESDITDGLKLMAWGLFKKVAIADRLAIFVNDVYARPLEYQAPALLVATVFFAFQIYCDFSGYSDIAIGAAQVLGIDLRTNFRRPFLSTSIAEFWTRWHVSLSSWFRDYVYIPLGGNRVTRLRWLRNVTITFLLSGLWHGASWTFVAWGCLNAVFLLTGVLTRPLRDRMWFRLGFESTSPFVQASRGVTTFGLVCATFVVFRAASFNDAFDILARTLDYRHWSGLSEVTGYGLLPAYGACAICSLVLIEAFQRSDDPREWVRATPAWARWSLYYALFAATIAFGYFDASPFIYFQF